MTSLRANLVHETTTTTGSGPKTLSAVRRRFSDAFGTGGSSVFTYSISNRDVPTEFECGFGHMSDANTLVSDSVTDSSNSGSTVNFSAGTKDVCCAVTAEDLDTAISVARSQSFTESQRSQALSNLGLAGFLLSVSLLALQVADNTNQALFLGNVHSDSFDTTAYVDTAGATNLDSGTAGLLKPTRPVTTSYSAPTLSADVGGWNGFTLRGKIPASQISTSGTQFRLTVRGGSAEGFQFDKFYFGPKGSEDIDISGSPIQVTWSSAAGATAPAGGEVVSDWISGTIDETLDHVFSVHCSSATDTIRTAISPNGEKLFYKSATDEAATGNVVQSGYTEYSASANVLVSKIEVRSAISNVTVTSTTITATSTPTVAKLVARVKEIDSITLNTDLIFYACRDASGSASYSAFTLSKKFTAGGIAVYESAELDISGQPSGTDMRWKLASANNKSFEVYDVYLYWR